MKKLLILNYHDILIKDTSNIENDFTVTYNQFTEHLDLIEQSNLPIVRLSEWKETNRTEDLLVALTFDDGHISHYNYIFPVLQERNIQATFFPIVSSIEQEGFMNWTHLNEIQENQHEIGSHGYSHKKLAWLPEREMQSEIMKSRKLLVQNLIGPVNHFALPYGVYTKNTLQYLANANYETVLTTESQMNLDTSSFVLHRFNIKNSMDGNHLLQLLNCNARTLKKRKNMSRTGLAYNRLSSLVNLFYFQKARK